MIEYFRNILSGVIAGAMVGIVAASIRVIVSDYNIKKGKCCEIWIDILYDIKNKY